MAVIPIFVSSTFRDFHAERDAIRRTVTPLLDSELAPLGSRCEFLDLRWGIDTSSEDSEAATHQQVLDVCLKEIDRCRPLFVGLVGDRFGWVPPPARLLDALTAAGVDHEPPQPPQGGMSITALEFWHGALACDEPSIFMLRRLAGDAPEQWREADPSSVRWLRDYLETQQRTHPDRIRLISYGAQVNDGAIAADDLESFALTLAESLKPLVLDRARAAAEAAASPYETAASLLTEDRTAVVVGRDHLLGQIDDAMASPTGSRLVLQGPSGIGKTTALLTACNRLESTGRRVATVLVGAGPDSVTTSNIIRLLAEQLDLEVPAHSTSEGSLLPWWQDQLGDLDATTILAIDGLDRLDSGEAADSVDILRTLPSERGPHFLVTTARDDQAAVLQGRGFTQINVGPLDRDAVRQAAGAWAYASGHRQLPVSVVDVLASQPRSGLWVRLAVDELAWLGQQDFAQAEIAADGGQDPAVAVTDVLVRNASSLPAQDTALVKVLLDRLSDPLAGQAGAFAGALSLTRYGLALADLQTIAGVPQLHAARARWLLAGQISQRDATGRLALDHALVKRQAQPPAEQSRALRVSIATTLVPSDRPIGDFSRLSDAVIDLFTLAAQERRTMGHNSTGPDHVLLGILQLKYCQTTDALLELGLDLDRARDVVAAGTLRGPAVDQGWDAEVEEIFGRKVRGARQPGHVPPVVTVADVLMACADTDRGRRVLACAGLDRDHVADRLSLVWQGGYYGQDRHSEAFGTAADPIDVKEALWQALLSGNSALLAHMLQVAYYKPAIPYREIGDLIARAVIESRDASAEVLQTIAQLPQQPNLVVTRAPVVALGECLREHARASLTLEEAFDLSAPLIEFLDRIPEASCAPLYLRDLAFSLETLAMVVLEAASSKDRREAGIEMAKMAVGVRQRLVDMHPADSGAALDLANAQLLQLRVLVESGQRKPAKALFRPALDKARALREDNPGPSAERVLLQTLFLGVEASVGSMDPLDPVAQTAIRMEPVPDDVLAWTVEAESIARAQAESAGHSLETDLDLIRSLVNRGRALALADESDEARECLRDALARADMLAVKYPHNMAVVMQQLHCLIAQFFVLPEEAEDLAQIQRRVAGLKQRSQDLSVDDTARRAYVTAQAAAWRNQGFYYEFMGRPGKAIRAYTREYALAREAGEGRIHALANLERSMNRMRRVVFGWASIRAIGFDLLLILAVLGLAKDRRGGAFVDRGLVVFEFPDDREDEDLYVVPRWSGRRSWARVAVALLARLVSRVVVLAALLGLTVWLFLQGRVWLAALAGLVVLYGQIRGQYEESLPG